MATVSVLFVRAIVRGVVAAGGSQAKLLARMGLVEADLVDTDARLPAEHTVRGWEAAEELTGDPLFGLHIAQHVPLGTYGVLDWATRSARSIEHGLHQTVRYFRVLSELSRMRIDPREAGIRMCHRITGTGPVPPRHASECFLATVIARGRMHSGVAIRPRIVRFVHRSPSPGIAHALEAFFACAVEWGTSENELELDDDVLRTPLLTAEPGLHEVLERHARELVGRLPATDAFTDQVRTIVAEALRAGDPSLEVVARRLATSPRTLQRRLQAEGTTFEAILDPLRRDAALRYLAEPSLAIGEVAFLLGYHDGSAFYRAFRRWTGITPAAWRRSR